MLVGRQFVAHLVFSIVANAAPTIIRDDFRATVARTADGEYTVTLTDDTAQADAMPVVAASPDGGAANGAFVGANIKRTASKTYKILLAPAFIADAPGVGFGAAPEDPSTGTIITMTMDRVDTV